MRIRRPSLHLSILLVTVILSLSVFGSPEIHFTVGFDEQVMRHRFTPFNIQLSGLSEPIEAALLVRQTRGIPGATQAEVVHTVEQGMLSNGSYEATLPLYEPLNPVTVELVHANGERLASAQISARLGIREWPFPIIVGDPLRVDQTEAIVDVSELPSDWWAYDIAKSVWLLEPIASAPILETLGEWVVSGGSLVLFTGAEFPKMDSPVFRKLLPIGSPTLSQRGDGIYVLNGDRKLAASNILMGEELPLLVQMPLGAGQISLVTVRYEDLSDDEFAEIVDQIDSATRMPGIEQLTVATLRSTSVPRPPYWITPMLTALILAGLFLFSELSQRLHPKRTLTVLLLVILSSAVSSGLYANQNNAFVLLYQARTSLRVVSSFGINADLLTLYATQPLALIVDHSEASAPISSAMSTTYSADFSEVDNAEGSALQLQANERRDLTLFDRGRLGIEMAFVTEGIEITNRLGTELGDCYVLFGQDTYAVPVLSTGTHIYPLQPAYLPGETTSRMRALEAWFPLRDSGVWLLNVSEEDGSTFEEKGVHKKVRHVTIQLVEGVSP